MTHLLEALCVAQGIPYPVSDKLLKDSPGYRQRQEQLLPVLAGRKWKDMLKDELAKGHSAFGDLDKLLLAAAEARNTFMHEGRKDGVLTKEMAARCIDASPVLLDLYAELHNCYVRPFLYRPVR